MNCDRLEWDEDLGRLHPCGQPLPCSRHRHLCTATVVSWGAPRGCDVGGGGFADGRCVHHSTTPEAAARRNEVAEKRARRVERARSTRATVEARARQIDWRRRSGRLAGTTSMVLRIHEPVAWAYVGMVAAAIHEQLAHAAHSIPPAPT